MGEHKATTRAQEPGKVRYKRQMVAGEGRTTGFQYS